MQILHTKCKQFFFYFFFTKKCIFFFLQFSSESSFLRPGNSISINLRSTRCPIFPFNFRSENKFSPSEGVLHREHRFGYGLSPSLSHTFSVSLLSHYHYYHHHYHEAGVLEPRTQYDRERGRQGHSEHPTTSQPPIQTPVPQPQFPEKIYLKKIKINKKHFFKHKLNLKINAKNCKNNFSKKLEICNPSYLKRVEKCNLVKLIVKIETYNFLHSLRKQLITFHSTSATVFDILYFLKNHLCEIFS